MTAMTDWEKQLARRRTNIARQERALEEDIADAHADGLAWRAIGKAAGMNHERARQIGERIAKERSAAVEHSPPPGRIDAPATANPDRSQVE